MEKLELSSLIVLQTAAFINLLEKKGISTKEEFNQEFEKLKESYFKEKEEE